MEIYDELTNEKIDYEEAMDIVNSGKGAISSINMQVGVEKKTSPFGERDIPIMGQRNFLHKFSDEEIEFITGKTNIYTAFDEFFAKGVKVILYSMGKEGSKIITGNYEINVPNIDVEVCDTTGAGDAIMGAFLYQLALNDADKKNITEFTEEKMTEMLTFANFYSNYSVAGYGAITSYADAETFKKFMAKLK